jgi:AraC-like DNA-binding protein
MIYLRHRPAAPLDEFIDFLWYYDQFFPDHSVEHVLPDGTCELVINLRDGPRKLFDRRDITRHQAFERGWFSGTHSGYIIIDALPNSSMIGAHFKPGGAGPFAGVPAHEVTDQVLDLEMLWGRDAWTLRDHLLEAREPKTRFQVLEDFLTNCLRRGPFLNHRRKRALFAVQQFLANAHPLCIRGVVNQLGISHKHFINEFRREVGLTPKLFCRIQRFHEVISRIGDHRPVCWADLAYSCGYADQSHFIHDFRAFSGLNPSLYLDRRMDDSHFVAVPPR